VHIARKKHRQGPGSDGEQGVPDAFSDPRISPAVPERMVLIFGKIVVSAQKFGEVEFQRGDGVGPVVQERDRQASVEPNDVRQHTDEIPTKCRGDGGRFKTSTDQHRVALRTGLLGEHDFRFEGSKGTLDHGDSRTLRRSVKLIHHCVIVPDSQVFSVCRA
jgi:hypothetical protein